MNKMSSQSTVFTVAQHAGVSTATVSRVMNNTAPVKDATRARVLEAINTLGYKPTLYNTTKRQTAQATIGLVIADILNPFFPKLVRGVEDEADANKFNVNLYNTDGDANRERQILHRLIDQHIDGIIVCASRVQPEELIELRERYRIPLVVINLRLNHPQIPCVMVDFENAAYRATQHLLNLEHRKIAFLAASDSTEISRAKRQGIEMALEEVGLTLNEGWCPSGFSSTEGGFQAMSTLLSLPQSERPTGVIAFNDAMALGAMDAVRAHRLRIPQDISIVGFGGISMAAHTNPPLTTIDLPKYRMGKLAMQMLNHMIQGHFITGNGYTLMESPMIVRESTMLRKSASLLG